MSCIKRIVFPLRSVRKCAPYGFLEGRGLLWDLAFRQSYFQCCLFSIRNVQCNFAPFLRINLTKLLEAENIDFETCLNKIMAKTTSGNHIDPNSATMGSKRLNLVSTLKTSKYMVYVLSTPIWYTTILKLSLLLRMVSEFITWDSPLWWNCLLCEQ